MTNACCRRCWRRSPKAAPGWGAGGATAGGPGGDAPARAAAGEAGSRFANWLGQKVLRVPLTDPMSGFFMLRRELVEAVAPKLDTAGFKVLFDIVACQDAPP